MRYSAVLKSALPYATIALSVWLAWQVVREPVVQRAPPEIALRIAPTSPTALQRAAELEFRANRVGNADILAKTSLAAAPFNVHALRTVGLVAARRGNADTADQLVTLAGNWSLRDNAAHGWLVEHRLKSGDYNSSFSHADTLARRREEIRPQIYRLFSTAALADQRALSALVNRLAERPPWRTDYIETLKGDLNRIDLLASLVVGLERTDGRFTDDELGSVYLAWLAKGQGPAVRIFRERLNRPAVSGPIFDAGFSNTGKVAPFIWMLGSGVGISTAITRDDLSPENSALRVDYDGFSLGTAVSQLLLLTPGSYKFDGRVRQDFGGGDPRMKWELICVESGSLLSTQGLTSKTIDTTWRPFDFTVEIPARNCTTQWLRLQTIPGNRRDQRIVWFDDLRATPLRRD